VWASLGKALVPEARRSTNSAPSRPRVRNPIGFADLTYRIVQLGIRSLIDYQGVSFNVTPGACMKFYSARAAAFFAFFAIVAVLTASPAAKADPQSLRWTGADDPNAEFGHVLDVVALKSGVKLTGSDFTIYEDRDLATSHFRTYLQVAGGIPIKGMLIRIWTDLSTHAAIQVEAQVEDSTALRKLSAKLRQFNLRPRNEQQNSAKLLAIAKKAVLASDEDAVFRTSTSRDVWDNGELVRIFRVTGRRGHHVVSVSKARLKIISQDYKPFPHDDGQVKATPVASGTNAAGNMTPGEFSLPARVYPIWEETLDGVVQSRVLTQLRHLKSSVARVSTDPYLPLRARHYLADLQDTTLGLTPEGQAQGFWSMTDVKDRAATIRASLAQTPNSIANGVLLEGRYATVSLHPDILTAFKGIAFKPGISTQLKAVYRPLASDPASQEMIPSPSLLGRPLMSYEDAYDRVARRLPDHDPVSYINDGYDEVQVYWSIDTLFESLHAMGFEDPELSTRPFNAFLYDPDIESRDNAFYTDDTINFTTYSSGNQNYARDNSTIWHELGHGIMDRLMGDLISLNDTGGLSEGMADFVAAMVISKVTALQPFTGDQDFRIINKTGFNLTNEEHDDGEAYGGAMYDLLHLSAVKSGLSGVAKVADLTMETMRLTRNHPALTATDWFSHMLFADERGHLTTGALGSRAPGELHDLIMQALNGRNFSFDGKGLAELHVFNGSDEVLTGSLGTRYHPNPATLQVGEKVSFNVKVTTVAGANAVLTYPLRVVVALRGGPLQGSINWDGEEAGPQTYVLNSESDAATFTLTANGKCDAINREDGGCSDYAYIQLFPPGAKQPVAKKRFYLRIKH
jgi:hypothetical protein